MKKTQLGQGLFALESTSGGAATTGMRPACDGVVDQRVSKLRPSCLKSYAAGMGRRSECAMRLSHKWEVVNRTALSR